MEDVASNTCQTLRGDCNMPVCDGWQATREIRRQMGNDTPIIGRGLHSLTFRLNASAFCVIGGVLTGC